MANLSQNSAFGHADHPAHLAHHFDTPAQQFESGKLGIWLFLATEILFFSGLFCAYAVYRHSHPEIFIAGHEHLDKRLGALNTIVLLCSSFTMAFAVHCAQRSRQRGLKIGLALTLLGGVGFMGIKAIEYEQKWKHGLLWGTHYRPELHGEHAESVAGAPPPHAAGAIAPQPATPPVTLPAQPATAAAAPTTSAAAAAPDDRLERSTIAPAPDGPRGLISPEHQQVHAVEQQVRNVHIFFGVYFCMTGLHGIHVLAGLGLIGWLLKRSFAGEFGAGYFTPVDFVGLYWHLVDLIWIYLFPLLYLIH